MFWPGGDGVRRKEKRLVYAPEYAAGVLIPNDWETELQEFRLMDSLRQPEDICLGSHSLKVEMDTLRSVLHHGMQDIRRSIQRDGPYTF